MAALAACGISDAQIDIEGGPEVPILDGSAYTWCAYIKANSHDVTNATDPF